MDISIEYKSSSPKEIMHIFSSLLQENIRKFGLLGTLKLKRKWFNIRFVKARKDFSNILCARYLISPV